MLFSRNVGSPSTKVSVGGGHIFRLLLRLSACLLILSFLGGCTSQVNTTFPDISFSAPLDTSSSDEPSITPSPTGEEKTPQLRVASSLSSETIRYLAALYTVKTTGRLGENEDGTNISLSYLDSIEPSFSVVGVQTPSTGATEPMITQWKAEGISPDILYVNSLSDLYADGEILPLTDLLAQNALLNPINLYSSLLPSCKVGDALCGIPYVSTAQILFVKEDLVARAGISSVPFDLDVGTLSSISEAIAGLNGSPDKSGKSSVTPNDVFAFYKPSELLPFLPASYTSSPSWFMYSGDGFDFRAASFESTCSYLRSYMAAGYSFESLTEEEKTAIFAQQDPRMSGQIAMWVGNTEDISYWIGSLPSVSICRIPSQSAETSPTALTVYPICVASSTQNPDLSARFAAFMALDEDALLLTARLEKRVGILPVVSSDKVWQAYMSGAAFGDELLQFKPEINSKSYLNPMTNDSAAAARIDGLIAKYGLPLVQESYNWTTLLTEIENSEGT